MEGENGTEKNKSAEPFQVLPFMHYADLVRTWKDKKLNTGEVHKQYRRALRPCLSLFFAKRFYLR